MVRVGFVEHVERERVAFLQLVQTGQQPGGRQAGVSGDHRVRGRSAYGQRCAGQMSGGDLQYAVTGAVIDGQFHFDARDGHVSHDAGAGHVERFIIFALLRVGHVPPIAVRGEPFVVFVRRFQHGFAFGAGHVFGLFHVACYGV